MEEDEVKRVTLEVEGSPAIVDTVVTLLRYIEACGRLGTTRWIELVIDGDGAAQIGLRIDGEARPLDDTEVAYLFEGEGEGTPELRQIFIEQQRVRARAGVKIEIA